jgi:hypothetical protein
MKNYRYAGYYRSIRTTQERRKASMRFDWADEYGIIPIRGQRMEKMLPNAWDDFPVIQEKNWKRRRKTQYRRAGLRDDRNKHVVYVKCRSNGFWWDRSGAKSYEEYFKAHDIPYSIEVDRETRFEFSVWRNKMYPCVYTIGWIVTWWSDKDIGLEHEKWTPTYL